jgi:hypothetical protein
MSDFDHNWIISIDFRKVPRLLRLMKFHPVGAELFRVDGQTDVHDEGKRA